MIYIGAGVDKSYFNRSQKFFKSLNKNSKFNNFIICVGFKPKKKITKEYQNIEFFYMDENQVKTVKEGWPLDRKKYVCLESGEFLDLLDINTNDIIIFTDSDMIMQRQITRKEQELLENLKDNEVAMVYDCFPPGDLIESFNNIKKWSFKTINESRKIFDGDWSKMETCQCGLVAAKLKAWKVIREQYVNNFDNMTKVFGHHAAGQWVLTWTVNKFLKVRILPEDFHNGHWLSGTNAKFENNRLLLNGTVVLFAHTKFSNLYLNSIY